MQPPAPNDAADRPPSPANSVGDSPADPCSGTFCFIDSDGYMLLVTDRSVIACIVTPWFRIEPLVGVVSLSEIPEVFGRVGLVVPPDAVAERSSCEELLRRQRQIVIPLDAIVRVRLNDDRTGAAITWRGGTRRRTRTRTVRLPPLAPVGDFLARHEFVRRLVSAGGLDPETAWRVRSVPMGWLRRVASPLGALAFLGLGVWCMLDLRWMTLVLPPDPRRVQLIDGSKPWTFSGIGLGLIGCLGVVWAAWLASRFRRPMRETVIERVATAD